MIGEIDHSQTNMLRRPFRAARRGENNSASALIHTFNNQRNSPARTFSGRHRGETDSVLQRTERSLHPHHHPRSTINSSPAGTTTAFPPTTMAALPVATSPLRAPHRISPSHLSATRSGSLSPQNTWLFCRPLP